MRCSPAGTPDQTATLPREAAPIGPSADQKRTFRLDVIPQEDLVSLLEGLGIEAPGRFWVPDGAYFVEQKLLLMSDIAVQGENCRVVNYGNLLLVRWRPRDLFCLALPPHSGNLSQKDSDACE